MSCHADLPERHYTYDFAFVNKSFSGDLKLSVRLYESVEKFVEPIGIPFYVVVPEKELYMFHGAFDEALASNRIKALPILMSEEKVFNDCGPHVYDKATKMSGWYAQQVVKMCFAKLGIARNYMTLDSDIYFTKPFKSQTLFKNGQIRTHWPHIKKGAKFPHYESFSKIQAIIGGDSSIVCYWLVSHYALWSSVLLDELEKFTSKDFADLINIVPYEMQWYAAFLYVHHNDVLHQMQSPFSMFANKNLEKARIEAKRMCIPTSGFPWHYGISNYMSPEPYQNPCGSFKTAIKKLRHFKKYLNFYLFGDAYRL
jgi:hypothetical protein